MDLAEGDYASAALDAGSFLLPYVTVSGKVAKKAIVEVSDDLIKSLKKYILDNSDDAVKGLSKIDDTANGISPHTYFPEVNNTNRRASRERYFRETTAEDLDYANQLLKMEL